MHPLLAIRDIEKSFGPRTVLHSISLSLNRGEIGCLLGRSGCGKTTLLRLIAGFETPDKGSISIDGTSISTPDRVLPPEERGIGMVFQDYALFPHLTAAENIGFGLHALPARERKERVAELLSVIGLPDTADRYPHELSGGQQQRIALARALAPRPSLLLLDEPFSNLDPTLRESLSEEVRAILKNQDTTALLVTHDQKEGFAMADRIAVMDQGRILQWDTPKAVYETPAVPEVCEFIGEGVLLRGVVEDENTMATALGKIRGKPATDLAKGAPIRILIRPDEIEIDEKGAARGTVTRKTFRGKETLYNIKLSDSETITALSDNNRDLKIGDRCPLKCRPKRLVVYPE